jgi:hypothetical protein
MEPDALNELLWPLGSARVDARLAGSATFVAAEAARHGKEIP